VVCSGRIRFYAHFDRTELRLGGVKNSHLQLNRSSSMRQDIEKSPNDTTRLERDALNGASVASEPTGISISL
jgi:hypothetical protein